MQRSIIRRTALVLGCVGLVAGLAGTAAPASAAPASAAPAAPTVIAVPMTLDCVHMSAAARGYATAHQLCPGAAAAPGTVAPDNTEPGTCGTSTIEIDNLGGGNARFRWGFNSTIGTVVIRSLGIHWDNTLFSNEGYWPDNSAMLSSSYTAKPVTVGTGEGVVSGWLDGWVTLIYGLVCTINNPWDEQKITI